MEYAAYIILFIYACCLLCILAFSLSEGHLLIQYVKNKTTFPSQIQVSEWPLVTIQLPLYNEIYVVERLLENIEKIDYPLNKLQVQVLDDSTDATKEMLAACIANMQERGFPIEHIFREHRTGYKAGALAAGQKTAKGEFIAIFDADFLPNSDFLKSSLPYFSHAHIGLVQWPWGHINANYSWLTRMQAFGLNTHFLVEQPARSAAGYFINFNGTAGIWRKSCIEDAGSWQSDTLTEDLDLSYRAQLKGWKFVYLADKNCPAELPVGVKALKNQQFRWTKGAAQCARKNLPKVWKNTQLRFSLKLMASFHLLNSCIFPLIFLLGIFTFPIMLAKDAYPSLSMFFRVAPVFLLSLLTIAALYAKAFFIDKKITPLSLLSFLVYFISFLSISMALCVHNTLAVAEGLLDIQSEFVRTPKWNVTGKKRVSIKNNYVKKSFSFLQVAEGLMLAYMLFSCFYFVSQGIYGGLPFTAMLSGGLLYLWLSEILEGIQTA